ncbi:MAG: hypothetical protein ABIQ59_09260 [Nocardioidaceae bacterium]
MATFTTSDDLRGAEFFDADLSGARFVLPHAEHDSDEGDLSVFATVAPSYDEVLEVRAGRVARGRDSLATVTTEELAATRKNPDAPEHPETVLSCLHVILGEEWEPHRYAVRDLDAIADQAA